MNLLILCPHYAPDVAPTGEVMTRIGDELIRRGHTLHVVTALPWYEHHSVADGWTGKTVRHEETAWGQVTRVYPFPTDKTNIPARALAFGGFTALAAAKALVGKRPGRPDAVLAMSPPLTLGLAGWLAARRWRVPYVFNIQDVFPDVAVEIGAITSSKVIRAASALERWCYRRADVVTVLSEDLKENVDAKVPGGKRPEVRVIPNFVDTQWIRPRSLDDPEVAAYRAEHRLVGRKVVMYAGNVGLSQSLTLLLKAARALTDRPDVVFVINGGGSARADLERQAAGLSNVRFVDFQPKALLPAVLAAADVQVVALKRGLARSSVPSKTYSIMAAGRPLIASVDEGTEVARLTDEADAGLAVPPDDPDAFIAAVTKLLDAPEASAAMGRAGRAFVEQWASPAAIAERYEMLFDELRKR
jgi:colanic acid biosynthesis glycosyl transferase WcaI